MTMQYDANFIPASIDEAIYRFKEHLKSVGWTVGASGDGLAAYNVGGSDVITSYASGANGLGNPYAWFTLIKPDSAHTFCFQRGTDDRHWYIKYMMYGPGFITGGPSPVQVASTPGVDDVLGTAYYLLGSGPDDTPSFGLITRYTQTQDGWNGAGQQSLQTFSIAADDAAPYGWWAGGYGLNIADWFRAGGACDFTTSPTFGSYSLRPDLLTHSPEMRSDHAMAFDKARHGVIMFGGSFDGGFADLSITTWLWNGVYWRALTMSSANSPTARGSHAMAYDEANQRVIMFGGTIYGGGGITNQTWSFDGLTWTLLSPATSPVARNNTTMVYSPTLGQIVLFGGNNGGTRYNDTWTWDGSDWVLLHSGAGFAPGTRNDHAMAIDPINGRVLIFGGNGTGIFGAQYNDTWQFDTGSNTWTNVTPTDDNNVATAHTTIASGSNGAVLPQGTINLNSVVQPAPNDMDVFGLVSPCKIVSTSGVQSVSFVSKIAKTLTGCTGGVGTLATGNKVFNLGGRMRSAMVLNEDTGKVILFGGFSDNPGYLGDTWEWDGTVWTLIQTGLQATARPGDRADHCMVYDTDRDQAVLWGGSSFGADSEQGGIGTESYQVPATWIHDGSDWLRRRSAPDAIGGSALVFDSVRNRSVWFGGTIRIDGGVLKTNHTWEWNGANGVGLPRWEPVFDVNAPLQGGVTQWPQNVLPVPRSDHSMAFEPGSSSTIMFGGSNVSGSTLSDTWAYDGTNWVEVIGAGPSARQYHAMAYDDDNSQIVLYGGSSGGTETWVFAAGVWTQVFPANNPGSRTKHCMAFYSGVGVVLYGDASEGLSDTWVWDGTDWTEVITSTSPPPVASWAMVYDASRDKIIIMGGNSQPNYGGPWVFDGADWVQDAQYFPYTGPWNLTSGQSICACYDSNNGRTIVYSTNQTWYSGFFHGPDSCFMIFDPIKTPSVDDADPWVAFVSQFTDNVPFSPKDPGGLDGLFGGFFFTPSAWTTFCPGDQTLDADTARVRTVQLAPQTVGVHSLDRNQGGNLAQLLPAFWFSSSGDNGFKGESSLIKMSSCAWGFHGIPVDTTGEDSRDQIIFRGAVWPTVIALPWDGSVPVLGDDLNGPGAGNVESYSTASSRNQDFPLFDLANSIGDPVTSIGGVILNRDSAQAQIIDDTIPTQEPLNGGGGGEAPVVTNLEPPDGYPIKPGDPISFDITVPDGFALIIPMITLDPFQVPEPVAEDDVFEPKYQRAGSFREAIPNGWHYVIYREGGWTTQPDLTIRAVSNSGQVYIP